MLRLYFRELEGFYKLDVIYFYLRFLFNEKGFFKFRDFRFKFRFKFLYRRFFRRYFGFRFRFRLYLRGYKRYLIMFCLIIFCLMMLLYYIFLIYCDIFKNF